MKIKLFRKGDIAVIAAAVLIAGALLLLRSGGDRPVAEITVNGEVVETVELFSLTEEKVIIPQTDPEVVIKAADGAIWFDSAQCRDKICVSCGKLTRKGDTAVCLPARTVITVLGSDVDAVTY